MSPTYNPVTQSNTEAPATLDLTPAEDERLTAACAILLRWRLSTLIAHEVADTQRSDGDHAA